VIPTRPSCIIYHIVARLHSAVARGLLRTAAVMSASSLSSPYHEMEDTGASFGPGYQSNTTSASLTQVSSSLFDSGLSRLVVSSNPLNYAPFSALSPLATPPPPGPSRKYLTILKDDYEVDFPHSYYPDALEDTPIPIFLSALSYVTPRSEAELSEVLTPSSLHQPPVDFGQNSSHTAPGSTCFEIAALPTRPRSSPTTFPSVPQWSPEPDLAEANYGLGILGSAVAQLTPASSPLSHHAHSASSTSESLPPRRYYTPIAPNPMGLRRLHPKKRSVSDDDYESPSPAPKKRKRSEPPSPALELTEEDTFLLKLKDDEKISWRDIAVRFRTDMGKSFQIPALQMRLKRLRERMRRWTEMDVQALRMAHEFWMKSRFEIIAAKVRLQDGAEFDNTGLTTLSDVRIWCNRKVVAEAMLAEMARNRQHHRRPFIQQQPPPKHSNLCHLLYFKSDRGSYSRSLPVCSHFLVTSYV
jgi:hypothetical protein